MKRFAAVAALLACVAVLVPSNQAEAGGILEFLFGSKPKMVQWFNPTADGDLHARNPFNLNEETFDLEGNGQRVVLDSGIPVERGLILVGTICPKTGPTESQRGIARLDGSGSMLEVVEGPKPSEDQEQWLNYMISRARYMRGSARFRGFQTAKPPYFFAVDSGLLMVGAHSVEFFVYTGKNQGASVVLPFRVVRPIDEDTGQVVASEFEAPPTQVYALPSNSGNAWSPTPTPQYNDRPVPFQPAWPTTPTGGQHGATVAPSAWPCWAELVRDASFVGYRDVYDRPTTACYYGATGSQAGPQPFTFMVISNGLIGRTREIRYMVDGRPFVFQDDGDGVMIITDFRGGERVAPVVNGRALREMVVKPGQGIWYPVVVN